MTSAPHFLFGSLSLWPTMPFQQPAGLPQEIAAVTAAESMCIIIIKYHPNITIQAGSAL
jgi:hypothetical protein